MTRAVRSFSDARGFDLAAGLAYSSLLSFVPLMASVTVLASTLFGDSGSGFYRMIRAALPGASRELILELRVMTERAQSISVWASFFFLLSSLQMFWAVEGSVNAVWGTTQFRSFLHRIGLGLAVIILGPVCAGIIISLVIESGAPLTEFRASGLVISSAVFVLLYRAVPRSHVRWGPAVVGGVFAGTGMVLLRFGFGHGVVALHNVNRIYGSISFAVIFVLAVGFLWMMILFGVALAHAFQFRKELLALYEPEQEAKGKDIHDDAVAILLRLTAAWLLKKESSVQLADLTSACGLPEVETKARLKRLLAGGLVTRPSDTEWRLSRPPEEISLFAAERAFGGAVPRPVPPGEDQTSDSLRRLYRQASREERAVLQGISLRDLYRPAEVPFVLFDEPPRSS
jgi:membrane protein